MKKRHVIILAVVLGLLLAVRGVMHLRRGDTAARLEDAGVHRIAPEGVAADGIAWLQVTAPPKEGEATPVTLRYEKRDGAWVIASRGGVPADGKSIDEFVRTAVGLAGETRGRGEAAWGTFGVEPSKALKLELGSAPDQARVTMFLGKQGDTLDAHFARVEGNDEIVHVRPGLRSLLGLWSESAQLSQDRWLKLEAVGLDQDAIERVTVERPDARMVIARAPAAAPEGGASEGAEPAAAWVIEEPALEWPVKPGLGDIVGRMGMARIAGVLDASLPACSAEPVASVTFVKRDGGEVIARVRGNVEGSEDVALTIDGQPHCWSFSTWSLATLVPRASNVWEAPALVAHSDTAPTRVSVERGGRTITARLEGDAWKVQGDAMPAAKAASISSALRYLRLEDLARDPGHRGAPHAVVSIDLAGERRTVRLLAERPGGLGEWYAQVDGVTPPPGLALVLSKSTVQSLLPPSS